MNEYLPLIPIVDQPPYFIAPGVGSFSLQSSYRPLMISGESGTGSGGGGGIAGTGGLCGAHMTLWNAHLLST